MPAGCAQDRCVKSCPTLKMKSTVFSKVYFYQNLDTNYSFLYLLSLIICERIGKIIARTLCFMHQRFFRQNYIFNNDAFFFLDVRAQKFPLICFNVNPWKHQQALHFGILNYEKQHEEGTCKVSGRSVVFSAFYADFCLCPQISDCHHLKVVIGGKYINLNKITKI